VHNELLDNEVEGGLQKPASEGIKANLAARFYCTKVLVESDYPAPDLERNE